MIFKKDSLESIVFNVLPNIFYNFLFKKSNLFLARKTCSHLAVAWKLHTKDVRSCVGVQWLLSFVGYVF